MESALLVIGSLFGAMSFNANLLNMRPVVYGRLAQLSVVMFWVAAFCAILQ